MPTPQPDQPQTPALCGKPKRNGRPCRAPAGAGADPGEQACQWHGGSRKQREAALEAAADAALTYAQLTAKEQTTPLDIREQLEQLKALRAVITAPGRRR